MIVWYRNRCKSVKIGTNTFIFQTITKSRKFQTESACKSGQKDMTAKNATDLGEM